MPRGVAAGGAGAAGHRRGEPAEHAADGRARDGTAGMEQAKMPDFLKALGQDMLKEPPETRYAVELSGAEAGTADFPVGEGDRAVLQADETVVGDGHLEDIRGEVRQGGVAVVVGLTVDMPGDAPDLGVDVLQHASVAHLVFEEGAVDGGEGFHRDKEVGAGGPPGRTVRGKAPAWNNVVDVVRRESGR